MHLYVIAKGFIQCKKSDPNIDECVRGAFQSGLIQLAKGKNNHIAKFKHTQHTKISYPLMLFSLLYVH